MAARRELVWWWYRTGLAGPAFLLPGRPIGRQTMCWSVEVRVRPAAFPPNPVLGCWNGEGRDPGLTKGCAVVFHSARGSSFLSEHVFRSDCWHHFRTWGRSNPARPPFSGCDVPRLYRSFRGSVMCDVPRLYQKPKGVMAEIQAAPRGEPHHTSHFLQPAGSV